ncbi:MAG: GTPase HflX [Planctomycetota bacterium]
METGAREQLAVQEEKAILVGVLLPNDGLDPHDPLGELRSLAKTAGAVVVHELLQKRAKPDAATFLGKGKVQELAEAVQAHGAEVVLFENDLSPSQIAKVEERVECKVLDRSELILDIFAARAQTMEARIQVEMAQLEYTYPRLRAMWSHLERIAGGAPAGIGTRGPGEQQLEIDRRIVQRKKALLKRRIAEIQSRKSREVDARNQGHYTVALVGYTNAGKSTTFNTLTDAGAYADDKLFATLSTKTKHWNLGDGDRVMLSDTVGFVRNLPHHLVASFRATLEEAVHSDLLVIVADVADANADRHLETVMTVLDEVGAAGPERLVCLNKMDKLRDNAELLLWSQRAPDAIPISAATGEGLDVLAERVRQHVRGRSKVVRMSVPLSDGRSMSFLENRAVILERDYREGVAELLVRIGDRQLDRFYAMGTGTKVTAEDGGVLTPATASATATEANEAGDATADSSTGSTADDTPAFERPGPGWGR